MVLVDTSVWIRFAANQAPYASRLDHLLAIDEVAGHDLVYGELLIGDRGGRHKLLVEYARMRQARTIPHGEVLALVRNRKLHGRGISWIDAHLLASALVEHITLWTLDTDMARIAAEFGVEYTGWSSNHTVM